MEPVEAEAPEVSTPDISQDTAQTPETNVPTNVPASPEGADNVAIYQDVVAKFNQDPSYEMSDAEAEAFLDVQDKVNNKAIPEPEPKTLDKKEPEKEPEVDPEKDKEPEPKSKESDKPDSEEKDDSEPMDEKVTLDDSTVDSTIQAMKKVGAKDITELPEKIDLLIKNRDSSGGKLGSENTALKSKIADMESKQENHIAWLAALKKGDPKAIEYLTNEVGFKIDSLSNSTPKMDSSSESNEEADEYLDDKLAAYATSKIKNLEENNKKLAEQVDQLLNKDKDRENEHMSNKAVNAWVDDIVGLVTDPKFKDDFGLDAREARGLAEYYWSEKQKENPINPKFQKVHELISFAHENRMPTLEAAHIYRQHTTGQFAQKLVAATKNGQKQFTPSANSEMSEKQSRKGNDVPDPTVTEDSISRMEQGNFDEIPDDWMDETGNLIPEKVPQRFHAKAFGRLGKPN